MWLRGTMTRKPKLTPPDRKRCQAEKRVGTFLSFGPTTMVRCNARPMWIATEKFARHSDGLRGSMSLCDECRAACERLMSLTAISYLPIARERRKKKGARK